ncbi:MAG: alpha/beta hydrolase [Alphaproteobacteria bacterium]
MPFLHALAAAALAIVPFAAASAQPATGQPATGQRAPVARVGDQRIAVPLGAGTAQLAAFADFPLAAPPAAFRRIVVVIHGTLRNADVYLDGMVAAVDAAGARETAVIAPQFLASVDAAAHAIPPDVLRWDVQGWKDGAGALYPPDADPVASSSFAALDALLGALADRSRHPRLDTVVLAGHSAGAQVLARYAAAGRGDARLREAGIAVRFVIANPSSYLYLDRRRPDGEGGFAPFAADRCPGFDAYKYGLEAPNPYVAAASREALRERLLGREIVFLLGESDADPRHRQLDRSCPAQSQGPHRLARGLAYHAYLRAFERNDASHHRLVVVPGVGHDNRSMFGSSCGRAALFADGSC